MNKNIIIILSAVFVAFLGSCNKDETEEKLTAEDNALATYMATKFPETPLTDGFYFIPGYNGDGVQPKAGAYVLLDYWCYQVNTSTGDEMALETTSYMDEYPTPLYPSGYEQGGPELWHLSDGSLWGLSAAIGRLHENETATFYISSRYTYRDFVTRKYRMRLRKVIGPDIKTYQESLISSYMKGTYGNENIDSVKVSIGSANYHVVFHIADQGTGTPLEGVTADIKTHTSESYLLMGLDLKTVYENEAIDFPATGFFTDIFKKMKKGGRVVIMMPYTVMFGDSEYINDKRQYTRVPNSAVLFDITVDN